MLIQYASDLHIEFPENTAFLKTNPLKPVGDILVLAGDIVPSAVLEKQVVISHNAPTFKNYPEAYLGNVLNEAFGVELFDFIEHTQPDFWIYGHTHGNVSDFNIGKTQLVTNQLGYVQIGEHKAFECDKVFDI